MVLSFFLETFLLVRNIFLWQQGADMYPRSDIMTCFDLNTKCTFQPSVIDDCFMELRVLHSGMSANLEKK